MASLEAAFNKKAVFNCHACAAKYSDKFREKKQKSKGCFDLITKKYLIEEIRFYGCVGNFTSNVSYLLEAFSFYEKGMLPYKGNLGSQPAKIIDIFNIIEQRRADFIAKEHSKNG
jgi:hypothetical protein